MVTFLAKRLRSSGTIRFGTMQGERRSLRQHQRNDECKPRPEPNQSFHHSQNLPDLEKLQSPGGAVILTHRVKFLPPELSNAGLRTRVTGNRLPARSGSGRGFGVNELERNAGAIRADGPQKARVKLRPLTSLYDCHPERSEGPAFAGSIEHEVLRYAQDDNRYGGG